MTMESGLRTAYFVGLCAVILLCGTALPSSAQDRLPPIPPDKQTEAQKKAAVEFQKERMIEVFGPFVPLSRSPQLMIDAARMGTYLRFGNTLPRALSEFAIILQARRWTQEYEWYVHAADAKTAGLPEEIIQAVAEGRRPEKMTDEQDIIYEFGRELNDLHAVTDRTYARALARFGEQGVMDLVGVNGFYSLISMVLNVGRTPLPKGAAPALKPMPR
jgi:4-carboxymuconolactone decarboxylase